jgi:aspartate/methionine/tyrosine aminotransferase
MVKLVGATPVIIPTRPDDGYLLTPQALRQALQEHYPHVKALILCNPSNPTGGVHSLQRLEELAQVLMDYPKVAIIADEIYERLVYPPAATTSFARDDSTTTTAACPCFASIGQMWHRTLTINGFSKSHAMTGLRLGYVAAPSHLIQAITTLQSQFTSCASSISQAAGVAALTQVSDLEIQGLVQIMQDKRDYVMTQLNTMPHVELKVPPQGAFYVLPDVSYYCDGENNDADLCLDLLQRQSLAVVPGSSFGAPGTIRLSYATSWSELETAMTKLRNYFAEEEEAMKQKEQEANATNAAVA